MLSANKVLAYCDKATDTITMDSTARYRRRMKLTSDNGVEFLLNLPNARLLRHGEGLELDDGRIIEVHAAPETLFEVRGKNTQHLIQLAWQIGNRHLEAQIHEDRLYIRPDTVIKNMLIGLGAEVTEINAAFNPERGAYSHHPHETRGGHSHE